MEEFFCKIRFFSGAGAVTALGKWQSKRLFLVAEEWILPRGASRRVAEASRAERVEQFPVGQQPPTLTLAAEGTARLRGFHPDLVVGMGRGSTLELAKAMVYFSKTPAPLVAIPITSGSHVTDTAVLIHQGKPHTLKDSRLRPQAAILDSDFLTALPKSSIAEGGFRVLAQALEACAAPGAGYFTDFLAREAFRTAYAYLPASYNGRLDARLPLLRGATLGALASDRAGLGLCHALSGTLSRVFSLPPGRVDAILLPSVISCNAPAAGHPYGELARRAGITGSTDAMAVRNLRSGLCRLRRELELPETLLQAGIPPREVWRRTGEIVSATLADPCCRSNPVAVEDFVLRRLLEEITGRG